MLYLNNSPVTALAGRSEIYFATSFIRNYPRQSNDDRTAVKLRDPNMTVEHFTTHPVHDSLGGPQIAFGFDLSQEYRTATTEELADLRRKYSSLLIQLDRLQPQLARAEKLPSLTKSDDASTDSSHTD